MLFTQYIAKPVEQDCVYDVLFFMLQSTDCVIKYFFKKKLFVCLFLMILRMK